MKIKYQFATETMEIEVSDDWGDVLVELDRQEYNVDHKETRRHASLEAFNLDGNLFPSATDVAGGVIGKEERERLYAAIAKLQPQQQELLRRVYFGGEALADIAREEGVSKMALTNRMKKIYAALQKNLK